MEDVIRMKNFDHQVHNYASLYFFTCIQILTRALCIAIRNNWINSLFLRCLLLNVFFNISYLLGTTIYSCQRKHSCVFRKGNIVVSICDCCKINISLGWLSMIYTIILISPVVQFARLHTISSAQESIWMLFGSVVSLGWSTECLTEFSIETRKSVSIGRVVSDCVGVHANNLLYRFSQA